MGRITRQRVSFVKLGTPTLEKLELDYTKEASYGDRRFDVRDALVKVSVRYREEDAGWVKAEVAGVVDKIRPAARHVFPVEWAQVKGNRARQRDMRPALSPMEAFRLWLDDRKEEAARLGMGLLEGIFSTHADGAEVGKCQPLLAARFKLASLEVEDYIPFAGKNRVEGLEEGVYGIVGTYGENARRSNRAGKSAFLKAVLTALFGDDREELGRGKPSDRDVHWGKEACRVAAGLHIDDARWPEVEVERHRAKGGKATARVDGAKTSVMQANATVQTILNFSRDDFTKIAFARAGDLNGIVGSGNSQMKSDLLRWLGLAYWERIHASVSSEMFQLQRELGLAAQDVEHFRNTKIDLQERLVALTSPAEIEQHLKERREEVEQLEQEVAERTAAAEVGRLSARQRELVDKLRVEIAAVPYAGVLYAPAKLRFVLEKDIADRRGQRDGLNVEIATARAKLEQRRGMEEDFRQDGLCPLEHSLQCPLNDRLGEILDMKDARRRENSQLIERARGEVQRLDGEIEALVDLQKKVGVKVERVRQMQKEIAELDEKIHDRDGSVPDDVSKLKDRLRFVRESVQAGEQKLAEVRQLEASVIFTAESLEKAQQKMAAGEERERRLRFVRRATGRDGIPTMQLENALREVEDGANEALALIEAPHRVAFSFQRELKVLEDSCGECGQVFGKSDRSCGSCGEERRPKKSEDISLEITDSNGRVQDFDQDSDGGKALAALALRVSLAQRFGFNVLFLDEVCSHLDDENLDMLVKLLKRLSKMGFDQVFIISHRQRVRDLLDRLIVVERDNAAGRSSFFLQA